MKKAITLIVLAVGFLSGCGPASSLNPLFTEKDLVFDADLVGEWSDGSPDGNVRFEKEAPNSYRVTYIDVVRDDSGIHSTQKAYIAHLVNLADRLFLEQAAPAQFSPHVTCMIVCRNRRQGR